jgi:ketosteroid isomerase-like protein
MTSVSATRSLIERYFAAINSDDWAAVRQIFTADGVYQGSGGRPHEGVDAVVEYFPKLFSAWKVHTDTPVGITIDGSTARADVVFTGTTLDGRELTFDAYDDFLIEGDQLASVKTTYDLDVVRKLLES